MLETMMQIERKMNLQFHEKKIKFPAAKNKNTENNTLQKVINNRIQYFVHYTAYRILVY